MYSGHIQSVGYTESGAVFSRTLLRYVRLMTPYVLLSSVCLSVCLSVTLVHPTQRFELPASVKFNFKRRYKNSPD